jgi:hypothetical protein
MRPGSNSRDFFVANTLEKQGFPFMGVVYV